MTRQDDLSLSIRRRWACPQCRSVDLRVEETGVRCFSCNSLYRMESGFPNFLHPSHETPPCPPRMDLTVLILTLDEGKNIGPHLDNLQSIISEMGISHEFLVVDGGSTDETVREAESRGARVIHQSQPGYGFALKEGFRSAQGRWVVTMDADLSHPAAFLHALWRARFKGELVVASRFAPGALYEAPWIRKVLSRILNVLFSKGLALPVRDASSGYRLYATHVLRDLELEGVHFDILEEVLIKVFMDGWTLAEVPLRYVPRAKGYSKARLWVFGWCLLKTFFKMRKLRSSIASADYDERAYDSRIPLQRWWQRERHRIVTRWAGIVVGSVLDIGCGSSRILESLPSAVGLDVAINKLRYVSRRGAPVVAGSFFHLPFADQSFEGIVCSQVVEHVPEGDVPFREMARVLRPGGTLVLGTPDYGRPWWPVIESVYKRFHPQGYGDEHITHYTLATLREILERNGFEVLEHLYVFGAELNVLAKRRIDGPRAREATR